MVTDPVAPKCPTLHGRGWLVPLVVVGGDNMAHSEKFYGAFLRGAICYCFVLPLPPFSSQCTCCCGRREREEVFKGPKMTPQMG